MDASEIPPQSYLSTDTMAHDVGGVQFIDPPPKVKRVSRYRAGDILFSNIRPSFKKIHRAQRSGGCSGDVLVFRPRETVDPLFVYYVLMSPHFIEYTTRTAKGAKIPRGDIHAMMRYELRVPPREEQREIGALLGALDRKIQLKRAMSQTLDEMIRTLFTERFETALRTPKRRRMPKRLPRGWRWVEVGALIKVCPLKTRYRRATVEARGAVPVLDQSPTGFIGYHDHAPDVSARVDAPVITFANHTCAMRLMTSPFSTIQNIQPFEGKNIDTLWLYYATRDRQRFERYKGHWPDFLSQQIITPPRSKVTRFIREIRPLFEQMISNDRGVMCLRETLDTLLSALISRYTR